MRTLNFFKGNDMKEEQEESPAIFNACVIGDALSVRKMIDSGVSPNTVDTYFYKKQRSIKATPLIVAILNNQETIVDYLLEHGALNLKSSNFGETAIHFMVKMQDITSCKKLIQHFPDCINDQDDFGVTPLMKAIMYNDLNMMKFLIAYNALNMPLCDTNLIARNTLNMDLYDTNGRSILFYAFSSYNHDIISLIFEAYIGTHTLTEVENMLNKLSISDNNTVDSIVQVAIHNSYVSDYLFEYTINFDHLSIFELERYYQYYIHKFEIGNIQTVKKIITRYKELLHENENELHMTEQDGLYNLLNKDGQRGIIDVICLSIPEHRYSTDDLDYFINLGAKFYNGQCDALLSAIIGQNFHTAEYLITKYYTHIIEYDWAKYYDYFMLYGNVSAMQVLDLIIEQYAICYSGNSVAQLLNSTVGERLLEHDIKQTNLLRMICSTANEENAMRTHKNYDKYIQNIHNLIAKYISRGMAANDTEAVCRAIISKNFNAALCVMEHSAVCDLKAWRTYMSTFLKNFDIKYICFVDELYQKCKKNLSKQIAVNLLNMKVEYKVSHLSVEYISLLERICFYFAKKRYDSARNEIDKLVYEEEAIDHIEHFLSLGASLSSLHSILIKTTQYHSTALTQYLCRKYIFLNQNINQLESMLLSIIKPSVLEDLLNCVESMDSVNNIADACMIGDILKVKAFLNQGVDINKKYPTKFTKDGILSYPLTFACASGRVNIVQCLLVHNAKYPPQDGTYMGPLHYAAVKNNVTIMHILLKHYKVGQPKQKSPNINIKKNASVATEILTTNAKWLDNASKDIINLESYEGGTALNIALAKEHFSFVKQLLEYRPNILGNIHAKTPGSLYYAVKHQEHRIMQNMIDIYSTTHTYEEVRAFLNKESIARASNGKYSILQEALQAAYQEHSECLKILISYRVQANILAPNDLIKFIRYCDLSVLLSNSMHPLQIEDENKHTINYTTYLINEWESWNRASLIEKMVALEIDDQTLIERVNCVMQHDKDLKGADHVLSNAILHSHIKVAKHIIDRYAINHNKNMVNNFLQKQFCEKETVTKCIDVICNSLFSQDTELLRLMINAHSATTTKEGIRDIMIQAHVEHECIESYMLGLTMDF